jgi:hypothetical protein
LIFVLPVVANYNLSLCAIFQDEAPYLEEWIDYHKKIGVEHFWLYNNNSTDSYLEVLEPYIQEEVVTLIDWFSDITENEFVHFCFHIQTEAYNDAIIRSRGITKWLALIDTDEFIVPLLENNLFLFLEKYYSNASGLCVNWQTYGTSHIEKIENGESMLKQLVWKMQWDDELNRFHKSIVQPLHTSHCENPHQCIYFCNHYHIDPTYEQVIGPYSSGVYIDNIRINHYWTRDEWFLHNVKIPRRIKWGVSAEDVLNRANQMNAEKDECILHLLD